MKFSELKEIFQFTLEARRKTQLFSSAVFLVMLYGSEIWSCTEAEKRKFEVAVKAMERRLLGITSKDHIPNKRTQRRNAIRETT